jgi:phosphoribosylformylglycinamidine cyclo-ligase
MAEHPGAMDPGEFDLVGFAVGVAERDRLITGAHIRPGDVVIGLPSPGLRSNGYSLARKVLLEAGGLSLDSPAWPGAAHRLVDELLLPSVVYAPAIAALLRHIDVKGLAHITGGGLPGNLARILPDHVDAELDARRWEVPRIFGEIQRRGEVTDEEMRKVFNMGIGMVAVVSPEDSNRSLDVLRIAGPRAVEIGQIVAGHGQVRVL